MVDLTKIMFGSQLGRNKARNYLRRCGISENLLIQLNRKGELKTGFEGNKFELWAAKTTKAPEKIIGMDTPLGNCPSCLQQLKLFFFFDETYLGDLYRADQQGQLEQKLEQDAKNAGNSAVDAGAKAADKASDASLVFAAGGVLTSPFSGGSSLTVTGYALTADSASDIASTGLKSVDAMAFDRSYDIAGTQLLETTLSFGAGKLVNKAAMRYAKFSKTGGRFVIRATQATRKVPVSDKFGYNVMSTRDASNVISDVQIKLSKKFKQQK